VRERIQRALLLAILALASCHKAEPPSQRLAILPFENLGADVRLDWIGRAASAILAYDLEGSRSLHPIGIASIADAPGVRATRVVQGYFYTQGGQLDMHVDVQDSESRKTVAALTTRGNPGTDVAALINQIARRLDPAARSLTVAPAAFGDYGLALAASDSSVRAAAYAAATEHDPNFVAAYISWSRWLASLGDRDAAAKVAQAGQAHNPDPIDRARLQFLAAAAGNDMEGQARALTILNRLTPADPETALALADAEFTGRKFPDAGRAYRSALALDPDNPNIENLLGYAQALAGDLAGAKQTLLAYQKLLPPGDVNGLDSLGEVSFYLGDFRGAEEYFLSADRKNPESSNGGEMLKAAQARLMTGDLAGADQLFGRYLARRRAHGNLAGYQEAQWKFITGRRDDAIAELEKLGSALSGDPAGLVYSQLAIWKLQTGDAKGATAAAQEALSRAVSPPMRNAAGLARYLTSAPATSSGSPFADALARLFARDFAGATPLLEEVYKRTNPSADGQVRALLAWALIESGHAADARDLLRIWPIPLSTGDPLFASLVYPRWLDLRARALQKPVAR
jgi:Flp pilus assembly protein TadD